MKMLKKRIKHTNSYRNRNILIFTVVCIVAIFYSTDCILMALKARHIFMQAQTSDFYDSNIEKVMSANVYKTIINSSYYGIDKDKIEYRKNKVYVLFAVNNLISDGIVWLNYSFEIKSKMSKYPVGAWGFPVTLHLKRSGSDWRLVEKYEATY